MHRPARFPFRLPMILSAAMLVATACGPAQPAQTPDSTPGNSVADPTPTTPPTTTAPPEVTPEPVPGKTVVTAKRIAAGIEPGEYQLDAYVVELKPCPECPPTISCKPCLGDFIKVHDQASPPPSTATPMLQLKPEQIKQFEKGKRYRFELRAVSSPGGSTTNHVQVESASALP
jgi:hypothetical protein